MKKTTCELLDILKKAPNIESYMDTSSDDFIKKIPLADYLNTLIIEKEFKKSTIINHSGLDRSYAYQIFDGLRTPNRDKVLSLCLSMNINIKETQQLLKHTGYTPLYAKFKRDSIILFGLEHALSVIEINELLYEMKEEILN